MKRKQLGKKVMLGKGLFFLVIWLISIYSTSTFKFILFVGVVSIVWLIMMFFWLNTHFSRMVCEKMNIDGKWCLFLEHRKSSQRFDK
ncbi:MULTISPECIES: hypothetical protein [Bacillaceae]|uniref:Uncharacterized protein n=1 Tax=Alkalicoccobacillus plakortidis TaxID=444060 RepID=A0A9D5DVP6_9BACI|nr:MULTISPECIES: hypothetical protein [Bacillaceae]KQL58951.1 hypothetical protein AN965_00695 [Alkalicoccobacillus plakortidis]